MNVLVVDDSALMRAIIREVLQENGIALAGEAGDGRKAVAYARELKPDLIIMDFNMPLMNGLEATRAIMEENPVPILVFSNEMDAQLSYKALQAGATEVLAKPDIDQFNDPRFIKVFLATLQAAARRRPAAPPAATPAPGSAHPPRGFSSRFDALVMGASTGGPAAVRQVLEGLPADFPLGIALVQHIEARFAEGFAAWLNESCALTVRTARPSDRFTPGEVVVAPGELHLVCNDRRLLLDDGPKVGNHRPSVDRLFLSTLSCYGRRTLAVLLTGMGADGAEGCVAIRNAGGATLVQDQATSFIYGMPRAAAERGGASRVLPLEMIAPALVEAVSRHG